jgi:hypothetical protein
MPCIYKLSFDANTDMKPQLNLYAQVGRWYRFSQCAVKHLLKHMNTGFINMAFLGALK